MFRTFESEPDIAAVLVLDSRRLSGGGRCFSLATSVAVAGILHRILDPPFVQIVADSLAVEADVIDAFGRFVDFLSVENSPFELLNADA